MALFIPKRLSAFLTVIGLLTVGSCSRIEEPMLQNDASIGRLVTVEATWGDFPETKTVMQPADANGKRPIWWSPGDAINLFYGSSTKAKFTTLASMTEPSRTASFEGYLGAATGSSDQGIATQTFWGVYPYDENNTCDGTGVIMTIPSVQKGVPGTVANNLNPSVANSPGLSLSFYNVGSWFVFSVTSEGITSVTFRGNNNEDLVGKIRVTMNASSRPVAEVLEGGKVITMSPEDGGSFLVGQEYFMVLLPQTLQNGYTFTMFRGDEVAKRVTSKPKEFLISSHASGKSIDSGLTWQSLFVDMGDGLKWATMNVGAASPEDYGDYFSWAETVPRSGYNWIGYIWGDYSTDMTKYVIHDGQGRDGLMDGKTVLEPADDAATVNWGGGARTPTEYEWLWLKDNCTWTQYGDGYRVTSDITGNSILLPAAGFKSGIQYFEGSGVYWSATLDGTYSSQARAFFFDGNNRNTTNGERYSGYSVRPVKGLSSSSMYVELGPGVKWAKMNLGATSETDPGDYFAWGATETYYETLDPLTWKAGKEAGYSWSNTKYFSDGTFTKYGMVDGRTVLEAVDDAASVNWQVDWRIPTNDEWKWLVDNCTWTSGTKDGVSGITIKSNVDGYKNNSIFLPVTGQLTNTSLDQESVGCYWSSSLNSDMSDFAMGLLFPGFGNTIKGRNNGLAIRPVCIPRVSVTGISLKNTSSVTLMENGVDQLSADITPNTATEQGVIWSSSDDSVVEVNYVGKLYAVGEGTATITATTVDGGFTASCTVTVESSNYVEMAPGFFWAKMNVGATSASEPGDLFAWAEATPKTEFSWNNYSHGTSESSLTKYVMDSSYGTVDNKRVFDDADDAVKENWNDGGRVPTASEWQWLVDNCTWVLGYDNGIRGYWVTSNVNGYMDKSIFIPTTYSSTGPNGTSARYGMYWSSTLYRSSLVESGINSSAAKSFLISSYSGGEYYFYTWGDLRYQGRSIRAVKGTLPDIRGHAYVDMGNGLKWATTNVGATSETGFGDYFAWGETEPYYEPGGAQSSSPTWKSVKESGYAWASYQFTTDNGSTFTKYVKKNAYGTVDGKLVLEDGAYGDDAASASEEWGGTWRMPTDAEWTWLLDNCDWAWTDNYGGTGVAGRVVTSNVPGFEDSSIFLPAAGNRDGTSLNHAGSYGFYWSSSLYTVGSDSARLVNFNSGRVFRDFHYRYFGRSVRPVSE